MSDNYHATIADLKARLIALEEDNAYLKSELGILTSLDQVADLQAHGLTPAQAMIAISLYRSGRTMSAIALWEQLPHTHGGEDVKIVNMYVCCIRRVAGADTISTHLGVGYRITPKGRQWVEERLSPIHRGLMLAS